MDDLFESVTQYDVIGTNGLTVPGVQFPFVVIENSNFSSFNVFPRDRQF